VIVGPDALRNVGLLYTTIMHEYQHVLQFRTRTGGAGEAMGEVDARLWEVEHLQDSGLWRDIQYMAVLPGQLQHWWNELTSTQQRPLRARYRTAQATIQQMNRRRLEEQFRQQTGGGSAAARTVQRQDALGPPPELSRQIAYAQVVLSKVPPLPANKAARLSKMIAGAPVYEMMKKRDEKRTELENLKEQVRMEAGARPTAGREEEIGELAGQIEQMDKVIKASLGALGLSEADLAGQVEGFVEMWVDRAKEIAITMLEQNERVVDDELNRYSTEFTPLEGTSTAEVEGLQNADRELQPSYLDLKSLKETVWEEEEKLRVKSQGPPPEGSATQITEWHPPTPSEIEYVEDLKKQLRAKNEEMKSQLQTWGSRYPILLSQNYTPGAFANRSPKEVGEMTGSWIQEIKENIIDTKANIQDEDIKVWHLHHVPAMTFQSLGVSRDSLLGMAVNEYIQDKKSDAAALETALTAFQVATIVAAAVAGGPAGAALVSAGWGVFDLVRHIDDYLEETAAEEVALDPAFKDISALEPSLIPIALDIISLGLDLTAVPAIAKSLGALRSGRKTAREFIEGAVSKGLSRKQAKVLAGKYAAHASDVGKIRQVAEAAYRAGRAAAPSLDDVIKNVMKKAEPMVAEWVKKNRGNIFFYRDIKDQLGYVEFNRLRRKNPFMFQWGGFEYRGKVFLNPAGVSGESMETLSGWLVHEVTHILTEKYVPGLHKFWQEFLGFKMQQRYLRGIQESLRPSAMEWLMKMSDHELSYHIATTYKTYRPSDRRTYKRAMSQAMAIFRHAVKM